MLHYSLRFCSNLIRGSLACNISNNGLPCLCSHKEGTVLITDVNVAPPLDADSLVFKSAAQVG